MKKVLLINTRPAQCSIYQSGKMIYDSIKDSESLKIDYCEIQELDILNLHRGIVVINNKFKADYDYYIFNYHPYTMRSIERVNSALLKNLPGKKYCIILEMMQNNPIPVLKLGPMISDDFDGYIVIDPTMKYPDERFHWFPRPLDISNANKNEKFNDIPIIGSFGYPTYDKGFHLIIDAASKEFEQSIVRINMPNATYGKLEMHNQIVEECRIRSINVKNVTVEITNKFMTDDELLDWCSENTLNCFFYYRNSTGGESTGLAAATDQCIISGRPLALSDDVTFRHIHQYITPYPQRSLKESISISANEVKQIQQDWNFKKCQKRIQEILK